MIKLETILNNEELTAFNSPILASGDIGTVKLYVDFDENWNDFVKTGVFYNSVDNKVYEQVMTNNSCIVPYEVLKDKGYLYVGVRGINSNGDVITSTLLTFNVLKGAPVGTASAVKPSDDIYSQIMGDFAYIKDVEKDHSDKLKEISSATSQCYSAISALQLTYQDYDGGLPNTDLSDYEYDLNGGYPSAKEA